MSEAAKTLAEEGGKLLGTLPAQFLLLVFLNVIFIGGLLWFLQSEDATHTRMVIPILEMCSRSVPTEALQEILKAARP